ncbi:MAG: GNAT family N-acetyltransferase [Maricaulaceae bacterium]
MTITTSRLRLAALTVASARDQIDAQSRFFKRLGVRKRIDWPPPLYDDVAMSWMLDRLESGEDPAWHSRIVVVKAGVFTSSRAVGVAGFKGPPDASGEVEIGYSIVASEQRRGYCSEAVAALLKFAFDDPRVVLVSAHTLCDESTAASRRVLERANFFGPFSTSEEGVVRYERPKEAFANHFDEPIRRISAANAG